VGSNGSASPNREKKKVGSKQRSIRRRRSGGRAKSTRFNPEIPIISAENEKFSAWNEPGGTTISKISAKWPRKMNSQAEKKGFFHQRGAE